MLVREKIWIFIHNLNKSLDWIQGIVDAPNELMLQSLQNLFEKSILTCSGDYRKLKDSTEIKLNKDFKR